MSVSLTADPKLVSRTKLNPLKLAKSTATEPHGYLHFCRTNMHVFTSTQYCIEKAMNFFLILLFNNNNHVHLSLYFPKFSTDQSVSQCVVDVVDIFCWYEVCVWWRRYLLFRHRNCIRAWPGRHWPLVHGSWYNWVTKLAPLHDLAPAPAPALALHHLLFLGPQGHTSTASIRQGQERSLIRGPEKRAFPLKWELVKIRCYEDELQATLNWV